MNTPTPSDLLWEAVTPVLGAMEWMGSVVDGCAVYLPECAALGLGTAVLALTGFVLFSYSPSEATSTDVMTSPQVPSLG